MKKRYILAGAGVLIIGLVVYFSVLSIKASFSPEKKLVEDVSSDERIKGTSIEESITQVRESIQKGQKTIPLSAALEDKDGYVCTIMTSYGPMSLKFRQGIIRQDILWSDSNTTAFITNSTLYRFSKMYNTWLKFDYLPDMKLSEKQMTRGVFSEQELIDKISPANATCIKADVDKKDFELPKEKAFDVEKARKNINLPG